MRILIAGGSGLLGNLLARSFVEQGDEVVILTRDPGRARVPAGAVAVAWDGRTPVGWADQVEEADAIVNLVGENLGAGRWSAARKARILSSRVDAGKAIVAALQGAARRPGVLFQASGIGYYGPSAGDAMLDEASPPGDDFQAQVCLAWEASTRPTEELGVRRVVARQAVIVARDNLAIERMLLPMRLFAGGPLGSGRQWFPWIYWKDYVVAVNALLRDPEARGVYNLIAPQPTRSRDFGRELARALRRPFWLPVPGLAIHLLFGESSALVLEGQRALPTRLLEQGFTFGFPTAREALADLFGRSPDGV